MKITSNYIVESVTSVNTLRKLPWFLVPWLHWVVPGANITRALLERAKRKLMPLYEKRKVEIADEVRAGTYQPRDADALGWYEELADGAEYDPVSAILVIAVASIHTTTDFMCQFLADMVHHGEYVQPLRDELILAIREKGWKASTFNQLPLLDSVMKESQRLKPISMGED